MRLIVFLALIVGSSIATPRPQPHSKRSAPEVTLDYGTFRGNRAFAGVESFLGMPFAKAGRLENPVLVSAADKLPGVQDATEYGLACPQSELTAATASSSVEVSAILGALEEVLFAAVPIENQGEDCLSINVQVPAGVNDTSALPIMMWIFGGGFELGSSASLGSELTAVQGLIYQGAKIVQRSIEMDQPIVFVSANYRVNAFGLLASQEITDANVTNLALKDQRTAMQWVQNYIANFGGDPTKVTIFGESAGSVSVATQMVLNGGDTEGLFRAAIMASGGIAKWLNYTSYQSTYDYFVEATGCTSSTDTLVCLRTIDYDTLYDVVQTIPNFFSYDGLGALWNPRPDGQYLVASPHDLLREGKIANVPYIIGDLKDEGTIFSLNPQLNITTDDDFIDFFNTIFFKNLTRAQVSALTDLYSPDPAAGSPFGTGDLNEIGPQYKRLAALQGDYVFQSSRRDLLNYTYSKQAAYTYFIDQSVYILGQISELADLTGLPIIGSFHASDVLLNDFGLVPASVSENTKNIMATYIAFVNSLDPNNHGLTGLPVWPTWDPVEKAMFKFQESGPVIITDDYREAEMAFMNENADVYRY